MLYAKNVETSYENFIATCPKCGYRNIFNRVSDLETIQPICSKEVQCFNESCKELFGINGDRVQAKHLSIFFDCYTLRKEKRYSACILLMSQSLEVFFYHYLTVELVYRPFWRQSKQGKWDVEQINRVGDQLQKTIEKLAYRKLREVFLNVVIWIAKEPPIGSLADSENKIRIIKKIADCRKISEPSNQNLKSELEPNVSDLMIKLKECEIHQLRNSVAHKEADRPHREKVDDELEKVRELLLKMSWRLDVLGVDINSYRET
jgi:hypothetical protein